MLKKIKEMFNNSVLKYGGYYDKISSFAMWIFLITVFTSPFVHAPWFMFILLALEFGVFVGFIQLDELYDHLENEK